MRLLRIEIRNFGKLSDYRLDLSNGLNTICHENGWGKSTLAVFIKAMLYGLPASRKSDLDANERKKYAPWNGGAYGGSLEFSCRKGSFRVERVFAVREAKDEFYLYDLATNRPSNTFGSDLGAELFGIDADGFERSVYLSERTLSPRAENASIRAKLTGLLEDPDDIGCYDEAQERIDRIRQRYELKGGKGQIQDLETELREKQRLLEEKQAKLSERGTVVQALQEAERAVTQVEAQLERKRQETLTATKAIALRTQYANMQAAIRRCEHRQQEICKALGGTVPMDDAVRANRMLLAEYRNDQRTLQEARLTTEEQQQLEQLSGQFAKGIPTAEAFDQAEQLAYTLREAQLRAEGLQKPTASPAILHIWSLGLPSPAQREQMHLTLAKAERLSEKELTAQKRANAKKRSLRAASFLFLLSGIVLLLLSALQILPRPLLPFGFGTAGLAMLGFGLLQIAAFRTKPPTAKQTAAQTLSLVLAMLKKYTLTEGTQSPTTPAACREALVRLETLCGQAQEYNKAIAQFEQRSRVQTEKQNDASRMLREFFTKFGLPPEAGDPTRAIARLRSDSEALAVLHRRKATIQATKERLESKLNAEKRTMQAFFAKLTVAHAGSTPEDLQEQIEQLCMEVRQQATDLQSLRQDAERFYRENRTLLDAPETTPESDTALRTRLEQARAKLQALRKQSDRLTDETADVPELTDRIAYLKSEAEAARAKLATLRQTAHFLKQAKDALSTRYLGGMQTALETELTRLGETSAIHAIVDSQLGLTLREAGASHELAAASQGTRALLQFAMRLALTQALFANEEAPFLLLDDPFISLDAQHIRSALTYLQALGKERQILYLVCHESRASIQSAAHVPYHS